ncbi:MAG TPA: hypothetical protein VF026_21315 [Ktedonobacteraceae bacterium]
MGKSARIWFKSSSVTAISWFTDALGVENDSKEYALTSESFAIIELASQVIGVERADLPANFGL